MALEIERKFLVVNDGWRHSATHSHLVRDAIAPFGLGKVRVRTCDDVAWITIKGPRRGISRDEFEYEIPREDAEVILRSINPDAIAVKRRFRVPYDGVHWVVDVYDPASARPTTAEIELSCEQQLLKLPFWVGEEVTGRGNALLQPSLFEVAI